MARSSPAKSPIARKLAFEVQVAQRFIAAVPLRENFPGNLHLFVPQMTKRELPRLAASSLETPRAANDAECLTRYLRFHEPQALEADLQ